MSTVSAPTGPRVQHFPQHAVDSSLCKAASIVPRQEHHPQLQYHRLQQQRQQALDERRPVSTLPAGSIPVTTKDLDSGSGGNLGKRSSTSLNTLKQSTLYQPRMAQLETLEAKMASIEVSLSNSPRRKKLLNGSSNHLTTPTTNLNASMRSIPKDLALRELDALRNALRDKENIIQSLKGQLSIPGLRLQNLRNNSCSNSTGNLRELSEVEKKQAEERLTRLRNDTDAKRLAIKNLKMALERLDITDNIDVRIQQAELEYQLGREELNLLTLLEETRTLQHLLEECNKMSDVHTLYNCLSSSDQVSLHAVEINFDPKSPRFGASQKDSNPGVYVDWALEDSGLAKGDRFIEVNGKIVLTKSRDDLARLLSAAPDPALIVVLRYDKTGSCQVTSSSAHHQRELAALRCELDAVRDRADESQRTKDTVRTDNIRLTHRISYLEEQVSEMTLRLKHADSLPPADIRVLTQSPVITSTVKTSQNITNINISSQPASIISNCTTTSSNGNSSGNDQVTQQQKTQQAVQYQKGSQISTLVASHPGLDSSRETLTNLPVRSRSSLSNVSNTHIGGNVCNNSPNNKVHGQSKHRTSRGLQMSASSHDLNQRSHSSNKTHHHHHHHHHREKDYNSETNSALEGYRDHHHGSRSRKQILENGHSERDYYNFGNPNYKQDGILTSGIQHSKSSPLILAGPHLDSNNLMDQNYRKATRIVHDLTRNGVSKEFREKGERDYRDYRDSRLNEIERDRHRDRERDREREREAVSHLYEKHEKSKGGRCLTASEKYGSADALRQQMYCNKGRKSTSVLDFRSEIRIGPKYSASDSKSVEDLDSVDAPTPTPSNSNSTSNTKRLFRKLHDARSVKSLDFDSDTSSYYNQHHQQPPTTNKLSQQQLNHLQARMKQQQINSADYISEPISNGHANLGSKLSNGHIMDMLKPRPTPPKKPLRLSLHRAQSLQSVESAPPSTGGGGSPKQDKLDANGRKPIKRNHKGEGQVLSATEQAEKYEFAQNGLMSTDNGSNNGGYDIVSKENMSNLKWTTFNQSRSRENIIYANESGHWC